MPYIIGIIIVVLIGAGFALMRSGGTGDAEGTRTTVEPEVALPMPDEPTGDPAAGTSEVLAAPLPDGTYTASMPYRTPSKEEYLIEVSLTTADGVITDATVVYSQGAEKDPNAKKFDEAYKTEVVGQRIDEINLSRVGGASLTTAAFNQAVGMILAENT